jgi:hypothetical protein
VESAETSAGRERDEAAIHRWVKVKWRRIKKWSWAVGPPCTMKLSYHRGAPCARQLNLPRFGLVDTPDRCGITITSSVGIAV